jgi:hypothetical protein
MASGQVRITIEVAAWYSPWVRKYMLRKDASLEFARFMLRCALRLAP